jgi:hypothetical protein
MDLDAIAQDIDAEVDPFSVIESLADGHVPLLKRGFPPNKPAEKSNKMSAEGRAGIAAAQKKRWAKTR